AVVLGAQRGDPALLDLGFDEEDVLGQEIADRALSSALDVGLDKWPSGDELRAAAPCAAEPEREEERPQGGSRPWSRRSSHVSSLPRITMVCSTSCMFARSAWKVSSAEGKVCSIRSRNVERAARSADMPA